MQKVGLICDMNFSRHPQFKSYFYAVEELLGRPVLITNKKQLTDIDLLIVGDDHYDRHKEIFQAPGFIGVCNGLDIPVIVLTTERILNSYFPWNKTNLKVLKGVQNLFHHTADCDDCEALGTTVHRISISSVFKDKYRTDKKKNGIVFIGSTQCKQGSYDARRKLLEDLIKAGVKIDILDKGVPSWEDYIKTLAEYRFVLSPIGNGNFLTTRFYETLAVGSIPLQQVTDNMLTHYDIEGKFDDCIFFKTVDDLVAKLSLTTLQTSHNELWTEDNLKIIFKQDNIKLWNE